MMWCRVAWHGGMVAWHGTGILQFGCYQLCLLGYLNYSAAARECTTVTALDTRTQTDTFSCRCCWCW